MEVQPMENSQPPINPSDDRKVDDLQPADTSNGGGVSECKLSAEEVKGALEVIASTGKFWHDWDELKNMLSVQLKQVLSKYPEATMGDEEQKSSLGESYPDLAKRLEEALFSFIEGPPFTLQRLTEILLNARTIYPNLSKLALALEKNLLVTSTLTRSTDPYPPPTMQLPDATEELPNATEELPNATEELPPNATEELANATEELANAIEELPSATEELSNATEEQPNATDDQIQDAQPTSPPKEPEVSNSVENGNEPMIVTEGDKDEVMSDVDPRDDDGINVTVDMKSVDHIVTSEDNREPANNP